MKILLEAHHPAHIHFWKYPVRELQARGHEVLMIGRDRDVMRRGLGVPVEAGQTTEAFPMKMTFEVE